MAIPTNVLQVVKTYQMADLAWMLSQFVAINLSNKKFKGFNALTANLGDTVTFDKAPRATTMAGLVISTQSAVQRVQNLTCSQATNSPMAFSDQQFIFQVEDYMERFGMSRIKAIGTVVEQDILLNFCSSVRVQDPQNPNNGQILDPTSGPFRFYGDGVTPINSYQQLATALANFREPGAADYRTCGLLPTTYVPPIVGSGLNQFAPNRNNTIAKTWMVGDFSDCDWYQSNLLPTHISGTVGNAANPSNQLTVISTNDPTGANITQITLSGATALDVNAIKNADLAVFVDGVSNQPNLRYLTFIGNSPTTQPVQIRVLGDTGADGSGHVVVNIYPGLTATGIGPVNDNWAISNNIVAGMKLQFMPSHKVGAIWSGDPLYLAMPQLPDQDPFKSVSTTDEDSGASIRNYWGVMFGQNNRSYVWDAIWGSTLIAENSMRVLFPL